MFNVTKVYSDKNGDSRFKDIEIPLNDHGTVGLLSDEIPAKGVIFREVIPDYNFDFHNAPQRQYILLVDGKIEIETSLGEKRLFSSGDILLMEDTHGKGHKTKNLEPIQRKSIFITLPEV